MPESSIAKEFGLEAGRVVKAAAFTARRWLLLPSKPATGSPALHGTSRRMSATLKLALEASGCDSAEVLHKPRLPSDNGSSYIANDLANWLEDQGMDHVRGAPNHPQTQGKIERWRQTLKNRVLPENYDLPGDLEVSVAAFVEYDNHRRYHESLANLTPPTSTSAWTTPSSGEGERSKSRPSKNAAWPIDNTLSVNSESE